jgi:predicted dehydrogenase
MLVVFQYEEGGVGTLLHSWETPTRLHGVRFSKISGTRGSVTFESNGLVALIRGRRSRLVMPGLFDLRGYRAMFRDFLVALRTGAFPRMTLARARHDLQLVEAAYGSLP